MIKVYKLSSGNGFRTLYKPNEPDSIRSISEHHFEGTALATTWRPINLALVTDPDQLRLPLGSCSMLDGFVPVLSQHAGASLRPLLAQNGELLPVFVNDDLWHAFNVTRISDALDTEKSVMECFPGSMRPLRIKSYVFLEDKVTHPIFKLPQMPVPNFVTEPFKNLYDSLYLTGFSFTEIWSS